MPAAIDRRCLIAAAPNGEGRLRIVSGTLGLEAEIDLDALTPRGCWSDYVAGAAAVLAAEGIPVQGTDLWIDSDVPVGKGVSSSAALEVAAAHAFLGLAGRRAEGRAIALWAQEAECRFVGMPCGIMDQFASANGAAGYALMLDCATVEATVVPIPGGVSFVVADSAVRHAHVAGDYGRRREECEAAARALGVARLGEITEADLPSALSRMSVAEIGAVIETWIAQSRELDARPDIAAVTVFENRGEMMGASSPHPHGQVWATSSIPNELANEDARQKAWFYRHGETVLGAYLRREVVADERIVIAGEHFAALVPFWASWPFETLILPRDPAAALADLAPEAREDLARVLKGLTCAYDALFGVPFPYSMGFHQGPSKLADARHFTLHAHVYPPLLRSAAIRKHMVGFEMLAMPQRDLTPEAAAARLRAAVVGSKPEMGESG